MFLDIKAFNDDLHLEFEPPQGEHHNRAAYIALKHGRLSMLDYILQARRPGLMYRHRSDRFGDTVLLLG